MLKYRFSLAKKQVLLSIALIVCTLLPLGIFIYKESVNNILNAYSQAVQSSLENAEDRIIQNWREQNVIRSLHIEKMKAFLRDMSVFTADYIEYFLESGQPLGHVERNHEDSLSQNIFFYIFHRNGDLYLKNTPKHSKTFHSLGEISSFSLEELDEKLQYSNNELFFLLNEGNAQKNYLLAHVQKLPIHDYYLATCYHLEDSTLDMKESSFFLYEILNENSVFKELLKGGFFFAYDALQKQMLIQSDTNIVLPTTLLENAIKRSSANTFSSIEFTHNNAEYICDFKYLNKEHILLAAVFSKAQIVKSTKQSMYSLVYLLLFILLIGSLLAFYFGKTLMRPLAQLRNVAEKIPLLDFNSTPKLIEDLPLLRNDEIGDLARTFSEIQSLLHENIHNLMEVKTKNERINAELSAARDMQMGLLPVNFPNFSYKNPYNLNAICIPAREVGGDLYDFFMLDEENLCFYIGDVSGKGMSAAFFMSIASTLIQVNMKQLHHVSNAMELLNNQLCERNPENLFLTLFLATFNIHTGEIRYASAGHLPALMLAQYTQEYIRLENPNFILGLMPDMHYEEHSLQLAHNEMLYIYTDGVTEAVNDNYDSTDKRDIHNKNNTQKASNTKDKFFGEERLVQSLSSLTNELFAHKIHMTHADTKNTIPKDFLQNILMQHIDELYAFCDGTQQADDITCLALYRP